MTSLPIDATGTLLQCGQCDDSASVLVVNGSDATCSTCGDVKYIAWDIARHLDADEALVCTPAGFLAYITVESDDDES